LDESAKAIHVETFGARCKSRPLQELLERQQSVGHLLDSRRISAGDNRHIETRHLPLQV
jgi:hypothetical protein